jgi:uncharacterized protein YcfJ
MKTVGFRTLAVVAIFPLLGACSTWDKLNDTERGAVIGGGTGAVVGSAVSDSAAGPLVGGAVGALGGGLIGNEVEDRDGHRHRRHYD